MKPASRERERERERESGDETGAAKNNRGWLKCEKPACAFEAQGLGGVETARRTRERTRK